MRVNTYWIVLLFSFYSLNAFSKSLTDSIPPSPFGEKIEYSEDQREICGQLKSRIESQGAMQHPAIKDRDFVKDLCMGSPWLGRRENFCGSAELNKRSESCQRNFFWALIADDQCDDWISFGNSSKVSCANELAIAYIERAYYLEGIRDAANLAAMPLALEIEELIEKKAQNFREGYELAYKQTKEIIAKWNNQETLFLEEWEKVVKERDTFYETALALQKENARIRAQFKKTVEAYDAEMEKGRQSMESLAGQLASAQARRIVRETEAARKQRRESGLALLALGMAISGGNMPVRKSYSSRVSRSSPSKYKNCNYLVRGEAISLPVPWTSVCSRNMIWAGSPAHYAGEDAN